VWQHSRSPDPSAPAVRKAGRAPAWNAAQSCPDPVDSSPAPATDTELPRRQGTISIRWIPIRSRHRRMRPEFTRKAIGAAAVLSGAAWTWTSIFPLSALWPSANHGSDSLAIALFLPFLAMVAGIGAILVVFGARLFRKMDESSLRWVIGTLAVVGAFFLASRFSSALPGLFPESVRDGAFLFVAGLIALSAYLVVIRFLVRHLTGRVGALTSFLNRGAVLLMAWQLWVLLVSIFTEYSPTKEGYAHVPREPWGTLGFLVPILVACGAYRLVTRWLPKARECSKPEIAAAGEAK